MKNYSVKFIYESNEFHFEAFDDIEARQKTKDLMSVVVQKSLRKIILLRKEPMKVEKINMIMIVAENKKRKCPSCTRMTAIVDDADEEILHCDRCGWETSPEIRDRISLQAEIAENDGED